MTTSSLNDFISERGSDRRKRPLVSSQWDHAEEHYHFLRTSSPGSWAYRERMPQSWLQICARIFLSLAMIAIASGALVTMLVGK